MSIKLAHGIFTAIFDCFSSYPINTDFYIFKTVESWGRLRIRSAFSSRFNKNYLIVNKKNVNSNYLMLK